MNRFKNIFCLFLFVISFIYAKDLVDNIDVVNLLLKRDISIFEVLSNKQFNKPISILDVNDKTVKLISKNIEEKSYTRVPLVYIFNTHQTEEYKGSIYNITPTVVTVSNILKEELDDLGISSVVETRDVMKEINKRGYDYSGTYTVSFENLEYRKKLNPSLEYFFDMHRDSITGSNARTVINGKKYATLMFLVGANHGNYKKNLKNVHIMEKYLKKNYPGLVRETYIQKKWAYNQGYSPNMFLVELGGPDNTLEEIYNTTRALSKTIKYYMEVKE